MIVQDIIRSITDSLGLSARVNAVFGEAQTIGNKTIIPVATFAIGFGAGGCQGEKGVGEGEEPGEGKNCSGAGGGGGGGGCAKPLAVIEVTDDETKVIPIINATEVIMCTLTLIGAMTWMITRVIGRRR